jgi:hypothetical protein
MKQVFAILVLILISHVCLADTWKFDKERKEKVFTFGDTKIVRIIDTTKNQQYPDFIVEVYKEGELAAKYRGISFETIAADKTNQTFVGLSNSGLPGNAVVVFHSDGSLGQLLYHEQFVPVYCRRSVTVSKVWYDEENPDIQFKYDKIGEDYEYISEISFRNCKGQRVTLQETMIDGFERKVKEYRHFKDEQEASKNNERKGK